MRPLAVFAPREVALDTTQAGWYVLADGGIADNTGLASVRDAISLARDYSLYRRCASADGADSSRRAIEARCGERPWGVSAALEPWLLDMIVMSDGSAMTRASTPTTTLTELGRTADVMYRMSGPQRPASDDSTAAQVPVFLISPKVFQSGAEDSVYWAKPLAASSRTAHRAYRALQLWAFGIDVATIRFMVEHMPESDRVRATEALRTAEAEGRIRDGAWHGANDQAPTQAERMLHDLLKAELRRRIAVFATTSTLRDVVDPDTADSLFLLGQYLVLINRHSLQQQVARVLYPWTWESSRAASDTTP
jgi:hypothetical protein